MKILISGASVAGPVLAWWLARRGFTPTVVERAPAPRKTGGHAVDLFRPAVDIVERMGLLPRIAARNTEIHTLTVQREGARRPVDIDVGSLMRAVSDRHLEIMRDDLAEIFVAASADRVEYVHGDSIAALAEDPGGVDVTFERGPPRRFDLVVGADGLHSNVRRLVFGDEQAFSAHIGAYLAVASVPERLAARDRSLLFTGAGRMAGVYGARHLPDARAVFLWRSPPLAVHHRDVARQKAVLREVYAGAGWLVPRLLDEVDRSAVFYFDAITQLRMDTWSRGRVTLVGDAGYSPGPAVGGSTSLAIVGAYVLAGELAAAAGDPARAFPAYEAALGDYVRRSRAFAVRAARRLVPTSALQAWLLVHGLRLFTALPAPLARRLASLDDAGVRIHDAVRLADYDAHVAAASPPAPGPDGP